MKELYTRRYEPVPGETERIGKIILDSAFEVHTNLGPGLLESVYETALKFELSEAGLQVSRQISLPVIYKNITLNAGLRLDLFVEEKVIIEIKAVEKMNLIYEAQLLTYLKMTDVRLGFLLNFNVLRMKYGIKRIVL